MINLHTLPSLPAFRLHFSHRERKMMRRIADLLCGRPPASILRRCIRPKKKHKGRPRELTDEQQQLHHKQRQQRIYAENKSTAGLDTRRNEGLDRTEQRHVLFQHYKHLRRSANMCKIAATIWLMDRGFHVGGAIKAGRLNIMRKAR